MAAETETLTQITPLGDRVVIRPAEAEDIERIVRIIGHYASQGLMLPRSHGGLHAAISRYLVADLDGEVIGCDIVAVNDTPATMLKPEYFQRYVLPNLQPAWQIIHRAGKTSSLWA